MADKMTLQQIRDGLQKLFNAGPNTACAAFPLAQWINGIDAHIAAMGEPVAWAAGLEPTLKGWIDTKAWTEGEFTIPLYRAPPASGDWDKVRAAVPTSWLDPMLTGPHAVIGKGPYDGGDIERVLGAVRQRLTAALPESQP